MKQVYVKEEVCIGCHLCELASHPWMVGCQFHPEFGSRPARPHPLFRDFIGIAKNILREGDQPTLPLSSSL